MTVAVRANHWLAEIAVRAGCDDANNLEIGPDTSPADAWSAVAKVWNITSDDLAQRVAAHFHLQVARLDAAERRAQALVPETLARRHLLFPLSETDRLITVATWNPTDMEAEQMLSFAAARTPVFAIAPPHLIQEAIDANYSADRSVQNLLARVDAESLGDVTVVDERDAENAAARDIDNAPVVNFTGMILADAVRQGASDIHLQPGSDGGTIRFRVDGLLRTYMQIPMAALNRVISRIKVLGKLDISDRLRPHDGRTRILVDGRAFDLRISTIPTREAEKAVIRVLDPSASRRLDDLSIPLTEMVRFRRLLGYRDGIVVVTGPTGSGKTTSLYAALREVASGEVNIMTVEDPVEYELPGVTQIQVEPKRNVTFATALRSILRQDPDVIFVGEIRDLETAEIAVQAALTGHLVLSTIHASDAVRAVSRLADLGLDPAKIVATLRGAVSQRLLRRVCRACVVRIDGSLTEPEQQLAERYGVAPIMRAVGCPACGQTGYRGRFPVLEVMLAGSWLEKAVSDKAAPPELQGAAVNAGMRPMREAALDRVRSGETTLEEIERVLGQSEVMTQAPDIAPPHVLIVDDDLVTRAIARSVLEKQGFRVSEAEDGMAALELLRATDDFKLMVLDLEMPRLGGADLLDHVRRSVATARLPVIVLTGTNSEHAEVDMLERGADDYVRKPIDAARFVTRVRATLRRAGG